MLSGSAAGGVPAVGCGTESSLPGGGAASPAGPAEPSDSGGPAAPGDSGPPGDAGDGDIPPRRLPGRTAPGAAWPLPWAATLPVAAGPGAM
ncbi:hypothetical protein [Streptomyces sp. NPDC049040]|uniref:hypothetical protein n=1 Tax=Streptomyces sp. NPDC049040 TaxID=3365593 RepID=UPI0037157987